MRQDFMEGFWKGSGREGIRQEFAKGPLSRRIWKR